MRASPWRLTFAADLWLIIRNRFFRPYFDVTTDLVEKRLKAAFNPMYDRFFEIENNFKPDL